MRIEGDIPLEVEEEVVQLIDFHYAEQFDWLEVDMVEGGLVADDLLADVASFERSAPFGWLAWTWIDNSESATGFDLSNSEETSVDLTDRGEQVVHGKGGLMETSVPARFPAAE